MGVARNEVVENIIVVVSVVNDKHEHALDKSPGGKLLSGSAPRLNL